MFVLEMRMTKERFTQEILSLSDTMYGVARTYLRSSCDCADAVQESILKAWASLRSLRREEYFRTWVIRILINECKALLKKGRLTVPMADFPDRAAEPAAWPELYEALMALKEKYRTPLVLYHCEGYTVDQIARILHLPCGTVTSRLQRGRQIFKREWHQQEVDLHE
jgi:RNA polymerase sigma-70 factor (ECF subfamily)